MAFAAFKFKRKHTTGKLVSKDRQYLEVRARRFLESYLNADETFKARFYCVIEQAVQECQVEAGVVQPSPELEDAQIAMAMSNAAVGIFLRAAADSGAGRFRRDAYATVAVAYRRAAGVYTEDRHMRELGTAAVHLLTMASSFLKSQNNDLSPSDAL
jgi:hypothetical protein